MAQYSALSQDWLMYPPWYKQAGSDAERVGYSSLWLGVAYNAIFCPSAVLLICNGFKGAFHTGSPPSKAVESWMRRRRLRLDQTSEWVRRESGVRRALLINHSFHRQSRTIDAKHQRGNLASFGSISLIDVVCTRILKRVIWDENSRLNIKTCT